jgi:alpha-L-fucosidase
MTGLRNGESDEAGHGPYEPTWESLSTHPLPPWFDDAKLGIFIHWGLYSVPAWAPPTGELGSIDWDVWFRANPYAEWYLNSLRIDGSPTQAHHRERYGADYDYYRFAEAFNRGAEAWEPKRWAALFRDVGARYVVFGTKHHDGFTLWPSRIANPHRPGLSATRDLVGELTEAVRAAGMRMGLYYSGGLDWTFDERPITAQKHLFETAPQSQEYADYADAHWRELIERYEPAVLWNDITYPRLGRLPEIFAGYYNRIPDGVINNRFGVPHADTTTPEYSRPKRILERKWEMCRGLGFSFGYNQAEDERHIISARALCELLVDVVSKNGNLLLNVGPMADGAIPPIQEERLRALAAWLQVNGEGVFATRPWERPGAETATGEEVRFTTRAGNLYAFVFGRPADGVVRLAGLPVRAGPGAHLLGGETLPVERAGEVVAVALPSAPNAEGPFCLRFTLD